MGISEDPKPVKYLYASECPGFDGSKCMCGNNAEYSMCDYCIELEGVTND